MPGSTAGWHTARWHSPAFSGLLCLSGALGLSRATSAQDAAAPGSPPVQPRATPPVETNTPEVATPAPAAASDTAPTTESQEPTATVTVRATPAPRSASATVLGQPLLHAAPHRNASELLLVVPGVFVSQHSGEGKAHQIFLRGFDAAHGQDIEMWAAGAPVNEVSNVHGQGYADLHFLIPEVVQTIRSTPGVYDPRQGDFAVAGSLQLELGYGEPGVTAQAAFGNFGRRRLFLAYHPESAGSETFGAFELENADGFGPARAARHGSGIAQARYDLGPFALRWMASTYAGRFDSPGVLRLDDIKVGGLDRFATYDGKQGGYSSRTQLVAELTSDTRGAPATAGLAPPEEWSLSPYLVLRTLQLRANFTGYLGSVEGDSVQQRNEALTVGMRSYYRRNVSLFSARDQLEAGLSLRSDLLRQSQHRLSLLNDRVTDDEQAPGVDADVRATDAAAYLDVALYPLEGLSLRGGLRADALSYMTEERGGVGQGQVRSALGAQLSKRATIDYGVLPGLRLLASYGEGFRSPQARSLGNGETTPFTRVVSYEGGLRFQYEDWLQSSLALFLTDLSDDLVFDPALARNELVPSTRRSGVSAQAVSNPLEALLVSASFTYAHAAFERSGSGYTRGDLLPYVPQLVTRLDAAFTPLLGQLLGRGVQSHFGAALTYLGGRPLPFAERGHDVLLVDARAALRWGPLETGIDLYNLLDADWYDGEFVYASQFGDAASLVPARHVTVGAPLSVLWSLTLFV